MTVSGATAEAVAASAASLHRQSISSWGLTIVGEDRPHAPVGDPTGIRWVAVKGEPELTVNQLMAASDAGWVGRLSAGDVLHEAFVERVLRESERTPGLVFMYPDHVEVRAEGDTPLFKPDFNLELLRSSSYLGPLCLIQPDVLAELGGYRFAGPEGMADLAFRVFETRGASAVGHLRELMYAARPPAQDMRARQSALERIVAEHLVRSGIRAQLQAGYQPGTVFVEYQHDVQPLVSIIVPTKDRPEFIGPCLASLLEKTAYPNFEVLVLDNGTTDDQARSILDQAQQMDSRVRILDYPHPYNYSAINNCAARQAHGEYLLLLNNDTIVVQAGWLDRMMSQGQRPDVGIVGARLVFPNQTLQHAGVILGMGFNGVADHVHLGLPMSAPGYMNRAQVAQEFSAVTAACLLMRKSLFDEVGGLDEQRLAVIYNDVDLCLKIAEKGYRIIWTPYSTLVHHGSGTLGQGHYQRRENMERARREVATMLDRWLPRLARDPAYNPNLSLVKPDFSMDTEVCARWDLSRERLRIIGMTGGSLGSREHRVCIPLRTLENRGRAACHVIPRYPNRVRVPSVGELAREAPHVLLGHNTVHDVQLQALENYRRFNREVFLVFGQDDLMQDLPHANPYREAVYPDIGERVQKAIGLCDRLIVTTQALADACGDMADDIRIVPNYLSWESWGGLISRRGRGRKPRVGWAGAQQHAGDLAILIEVVEATADEVQWVFFGQCLAEMLPYGVEVHNPVAFEAYPARLASLDLDLAVAPLAHNRFNAAKSNLKILEYGVLGVPVICSDIEPYRGAPAQRVANDSRAWVDAIRERIHDLDAAAREGDALRRWVVEGWMLEDHLTEWLSALMPGDAADQHGCAGQAEHSAEAGCQSCRPTGSGG